MTVETSFQPTTEYQKNTRAAVLEWLAIKAQDQEARREFSTCCVEYMSSIDDTYSQALLNHLTSMEHISHLHGVKAIDMHQDLKVYLSYSMRS